MVVRYLLEPSRLAESARWIARDGLHPDVYAYHPACIEQRMIVADKYIVKIGDDAPVLRTLESEQHRIELLKSHFDLLHHVDTHAAHAAAHTGSSNNSPATVAYRERHITTSRPLSSALSRRRSGMDQSHNSRSTNNGCQREAASRGCRYQ